MNFHIKATSKKIIETINQLSFYLKIVLLWFSELFVYAIYYSYLRAGSCTSELQLKMNCRLKVNYRKKFELVCQLLADPAPILSYNSLSVYNSLSASIHLYMIRAQVTLHI